MLIGEDELLQRMKIAGFLVATAETFAATIRRLLLMCGCEVSAFGENLDLRYEIGYHGRVAVLYFRNLYLEIATVDRDAEPLEFDEKLRDFGYFSSKAVHVIKSKLTPLMQMLEATDLDETIGEILENFSGERIVVEKTRRENGTGQSPATE